MSLHWENSSEFRHNADISPVILVPHKKLEERLSSLQRVAGISSCSHQTTRLVFWKWFFVRFCCRLENFCEKMFSPQRVTFHLFKCFGKYRGEHHWSLPETAIVEVLWRETLMSSSVLTLCTPRTQPILWRHAPLHMRRFACVLVKLETSLVFPSQALRSGAFQWIWQHRRIIRLPFAERSQQRCFLFLLVFKN